MKAGQLCQRRVDYLVEKALDATLLQPAADGAAVFFRKETQEYHR